MNSFSSTIEQELANKTGTLEVIDLALIDPSPSNFTRTFEGDSFGELMQSISSLGILQPPRIRRSKADPDRFETVFGHRRLESARRLGWPEVQCYVCESSQDDVYMLKSMVVENATRENPNELEVAEKLKALADVMGVTLAAAGAELGFSPSRCTSYNRLLGAGTAIKELVVSGASTDLRGISDLARATEAAPHLEAVAVDLVNSGSSAREVARAIREAANTEMPVHDAQAALMKRFGGEDVDQGYGSNEMHGSSHDDGLEGLIAMGGPIVKSDFLNGPVDDDDVAIIKPTTTKSTKKTKSSSDDDKEPTARLAFEATVEPVLIQFKERKGKDRKSYTPDSKEAIIIHIKMKAKTLQFRLDHSEAMLFLCEASALRDKIAKGEEGERRVIMSSTAYGKENTHPDDE